MIGQGTLAAGLYFNLPEDAWITSSAEEANLGKSFSETKTECDVLVVGGGIAACFAAMKAKVQGANVILVDKGYAGRSGQSPFSSGLAVFDPDKGQKLEDWSSAINRYSEYVNNHYWSDLCIQQSRSVYQDMVSWGVPFRNANGERAGSLPGTGAIPSSIFTDVGYGGKTGDHVYALRLAVEKSGIKILDRVMIAELLKQNGRIVGAIGLSAEKFELYTFIAKTTILCVGACAYKPIGYPALNQLTGDGEAMAYRMGAEILGKEFVDTHRPKIDTPKGRGGMLSRLDRNAIPANLQPLLTKGEFVYEVDAAGNRLPDRPVEASPYRLTYLQQELMAHAGQAPIYRVFSDGSKAEWVGGSCLGMSIRKADGLWPADKECRSNVPGLFAAGDSLGNMQNGAVYAFAGGSTLGSAVTGGIAGTAAAKEALKMGKLAVDEKEIARAKQFVRVPSERKGGFSPRWVARALYNTMAPYYVYFVKKADRLQAALTQVEFMQEHLVPMLIARDPHELRLAHETRSMVLSAEFRLRSGLFRTESRGNHFREEFPRRDDPNWLAWTKIKPVQGKMMLIKVPMPREWWPDLSIPYETRYPVRYPGEEKS